MNRLLDRRSVLRAGLALYASLVIPPARACEYFTGTLRIVHPWTRVTDADSAAVVCMTFDEVTETDRLIGVKTPVAAVAELVADGTSGEVNLLIPAGSETLLTDDGTHIRLVDLKEPLLIARSYPLKLVFEKAGVVNALLNVDYIRAGFAPLRLRLPGQRP